MFLKPFEIRWSDVDANAHLANSAYLNFMSHTRVSFFETYGFSMRTLNLHKIGPVLFYEHVHYFKESYLGMKLNVSLELIGLSEDGMFFMFEHNFYDEKGKHLAQCEIMGSWIDLKSRKLVPLTEQLLTQFRTIPHSDKFKVLTKEDTRKYARVPKDIRLPN